MKETKERWIHIESTNTFNILVIFQIVCDELIVCVLNAGTQFTLFDIMGTEIGSEHILAFKLISCNNEVLIIREYIGYDSRDQATFHIDSTEEIYSGNELHNLTYSGDDFIHEFSAKQTEFRVTKILIAVIAAILFVIFEL
jgi:hypothetical protein